MADPNWLLSTSAQSAAAIVAIVGGFLVSRLVTLSAERNSLIRRRDEVGALLNVKESEREELEGQQEGDEAVGIISDALDGLIEAKGEMRLEEMLESYGDPWDKPSEKLASHLDEVNATIQHALADLESPMRASTERPPRSFQSFARANGIKYEEWQESVYEAVYREIRDQLPRRTRSSPLGLSIDPEDFIGPAFERMPTIVRGPTISERLESLGSEIRALRAEVAHLNEQLSRVANPEGVGRAIGILEPTSRRSAWPFRFRSCP